ncbi:MAG: hypothetical protein Q8R12_01165, partial [bacterium]|nr:hypothetical protein [bacterium]
FFAGNAVSTFEDFLFEGLKLSLSRLHRATPRFSRHILRKLLFEKNYPSFEDRKHYSGLPFELQRAILQLKKNGLNPSKASALFKRFLNHELEDFLKIFSDYQNLLESLDTSDEGDCVSKTLNLLHENKYCFPPSLNAIFCDRLFPLSLGHREVFREMLNRYPEKKWIVATSFDYKSDDDPHLYPAFGFMGELATQTKYFEPRGLLPQTELTSFPQAAMEADWIADEISSELKRGVSPDAIFVILPPFSFTHQRLTQILSARGIPCFNPYRPTLYESLASSQIPMERLIKTFRGGNQGILADTLGASSEMESFMEEWKFDTDRLFSDNIPLESMQGWITEELKQVRVSRVKGGGGVFLSSLAGSLSLDATRLIVAGFTDRNYPGLSGEHPFFTNEMLERPELREILVSPFYRFSVEKNILSQILRRTKERVTLTYPRMDWDGGDLFVSRLLGSEIPAETRKAQSQTINSSSLSQKSRFPRLQKKHYGITELEDYL